jgi:hypothetical protein
MKSLLFFLCLVNLKVIVLGEVVVPINLEEKVEKSREGLEKSVEIKNSNEDSHKECQIKSIYKVQMRKRDPFWNESKKNKHKRHHRREKPKPQVVSEDVPINKPEEGVTDVKSESETEATPSETKVEEETTKTHLITLNELKKVDILVEDMKNDNIISINQQEQEVEQGIINQGEINSSKDIITGENPLQKQEARSQQLIDMDVSSKKDQKYDTIKNNKSSSCFEGCLEKCKNTYLVKTDLIECALKVCRCQDSAISQIIQNPKMEIPTEDKSDIIGIILNILIAISLSSLIISLIVIFTILYKRKQRSDENKYERPIEQDSIDLDIEDGKSKELIFKKDLSYSLISTESDLDAFSIKDF